MKNILDRVVNVLSLMLYLYLQERINVLLLSMIPDFPDLIDSIKRAIK